MMDSYIAAKIRRVKLDPRYTEVLQLQRLPLPEPEELEMDPAPTTTDPQASISQESSFLAPQSSSPTPKEEAIDSAGQKVLSATYTSSAEVDGKQPPYNKNLESVDLDFNRNYGYDNMAGIIRVIDYGALNGGWAPLITQQRGSCLFHAVRRSIQCPKELTNMHFRRTVVNFICDRVDELFPMLKVAISGNYGHLRLTLDEYNRKLAEGTITNQ